MSFCLIKTHPLVWYEGSITHDLSLGTRHTPDLGIKHMWGRVGKSNRTKIRQHKQNMSSHMAQSSFVSEPLIRYFHHKLAGMNVRQCGQRLRTPLAHTESAAVRSVEETADGLWRTTNCVRTQLCFVPCAASPDGRNIVVIVSGTGLTSGQGRLFRLYVITKLNASVFACYFWTNSCLLHHQDVRKTIRVRGGALRKEMAGWRTVRPWILDVCRLREMRGGWGPTIASTHKDLVCFVYRYFYSHLFINIYICIHIHLT